MASQRHHLTNNLHHITAHRWRAASAFGDEEWPITDHPVLTLNYYAPDQYDFGAGWGKVGSEFIVPISPKVALYTKIGDNTTGPFTFSAEQSARCNASWLSARFVGSSRDENWPGSRLPIRGK